MPCGRPGAVAPPSPQRRDSARRRGGTSWNRGNLIWWWRTWHCLALNIPKGCRIDLRQVTLDRHAECQGQLCVIRKEHICEVKLQVEVTASQYPVALERGPEDDESNEVRAGVAHVDRCSGLNHSPRLPCQRGHVEHEQILPGDGHAGGSGRSPCACCRLLLPRACEPAPII